MPRAPNGPGREGDAFGRHVETIALIDCPGQRFVKRPEPQPKGWLYGRLHLEGLVLLAAVCPRRDERGIEPPEGPVEDRARQHFAGARKAPTGALATDEAQVEDGIAMNPLGTRTRPYFKGYMYMYLRLAGDGRAGCRCTAKEDHKCRCTAQNNVHRRHRAA